jgi:hypothetical protein
MGMTKRATKDAKNMLSDQDPRRFKVTRKEWENIVDYLEKINRPLDVGPHKSGKHSHVGLRVPKIPL